MRKRGEFYIGQRVQLNKVGRAASKNLVTRRKGAEVFATVKGFGDTGTVSDYATRDFYLKVLIDGNATVQDGGNAAYWTPVPKRSPAAPSPQEKP